MSRVWGEIIKIILDGGFGGLGGLGGFELLGTVPNYITPPFFGDGSCAFNSLPANEL